MATTFTNLGAKHIDDEWIKSKYVSALMPFEPIDLKSLQGRYNYYEMTSNQVMQEMQAFKVQAKNAEDARARAIGMQRGANLALKANVVENEESQRGCEDGKPWSPEDVQYAFSEHMCFHSKSFWKDPSKAIEQNSLRSKSRDNPRSDSSGQRVRYCYNCGDRFHFVAECPYENREDNGGKLVLKDKSKLRKKPFVKKKFPTKKGPRIVLMAQEEYSTDEESDEEETSNEMAAIATTSTSSTSLFESPNENLPNKNVKCLMAKSSEVPSSSFSTPKARNDNMSDATSLKVKEELVAFDTYLTNLQGDHKKYVSACMSKLGQANAIIEKKGEIERDDAIEIASLNHALEEEQEIRASLEEKLEYIEEVHNELVAKLIKERDHARDKVVVLKKQKVEFGIGHDKLVLDLENLGKANKALENEFSILTKLHEQLQIQLTRLDMPSTSTPPCDHANVIEENSRLKDELAKVSSPIGEKNLNDLLSNQRTNNGKEGIGFVAKKKKKNHKKKAKSAQVNDSIVSGDATRGKATHNDFAGIANPHYVLFRDYYGDVYAKYVGPNDGYIAWSIWVPKTLVANKRGPIEK
jgi:hypothetical protein